MAVGEAKVVAFFSFGEALYGGAYYDSQAMENVLKAECLGMKSEQIYTRHSSRSRAARVHRLPSTDGSSNGAT